MALADIALIGSPMGGGWAVPQTETGEEACLAFFGEDPIGLPLGNASGYIIEPCNGDYVLNELVLAGCSVETASGVIVTEPRS